MLSRLSSLAGGWCWMKRWRTRTVYGMALVRFMVRATLMGRNREEEAEAVDSVMPYRLLRLTIWFWCGEEGASLQVARGDACGLFLFVLIVLWCLGVVFVFMWCTRWYLERPRRGNDLFLSDIGGDRSDEVDDWPPWYMMPVAGTVPVKLAKKTMRNVCNLYSLSVAKKELNLRCLSFASIGADDSVRLDVSPSWSESDSSLSGSLREWRRLPFELWTRRRNNKMASLN